MDSTYFNQLAAANIDSDSATIANELDAVSMGNLDAAKAAFLTPKTKYKLYATKAGNTDEAVHELLNFTTDEDYTYNGSEEPFWGYPAFDLPGVKAEEYTFFFIKVPTATKITLRIGSDGIYDCGVLFGCQPDVNFPTSSEPFYSVFFPNSGYKEIVMVIKSFYDKPSTFTLEPNPSGSASEYEFNITYE
mgnify:CR=1 FL=1